MRKKGRGKDNLSADVFFRKLENLFKSVKILKKYVYSL